MSRRYPSELHEFMRSFIPGHTALEISKAVHDQFGIEMTAGQVKSYKQNHHIRSGTPGGQLAGQSRVFPAEVWQYILDNHHGVGSAEMAGRINVKFNTNYTPRQVAAFYKNHNLRSGVDCRFQKGHASPNKGKKGMLMHPNAVATQFKKGSTPRISCRSERSYRKATGICGRKPASGQPTGNSFTVCYGRRPTVPFRRGICSYFWTETG